MDPLCLEAEASHWSRTCHDGFFCHWLLYGSTLKENIVRTINFLQIYRCWEHIWWPFLTHFAIVPCFSWGILETPTCSKNSAGAAKSRWRGLTTSTWQQARNCHGWFTNQWFCCLVLFPKDLFIITYNNYNFNLENLETFIYMAVCQNLVPLVNIKIAGKWMFIPLKMVLIGIDPYPYQSSTASSIFSVNFLHSLLLC